MLAPDQARRELILQQRKDWIEVQLIPQTVDLRQDASRSRECEFREDGRGLGKQPIWRSCRAMQSVQH